MKFHIQRERKSEREEGRDRDGEREAKCFRERSSRVSTAQASSSASPPYMCTRTPLLCTCQCTNISIFSHVCDFKSPTNFVKDKKVANKAKNLI